MRIEYSQHIRNRLQIRKIDYDLPRIIFEQSDERYFDMDTGHSIAVMKVNLYNKNRDVMVAYVIEENYAKLLTIHPLKEGQKDSRVNMGRWREM